MSWSPSTDLLHDWSAQGGNRRARLTGLRHRRESTFRRRVCI
jgi:hypothetical protein